MGEMRIRRRSGRPEGVCAVGLLARDARRPARLPRLPSVAGITLAMLVAATCGAQGQDIAYGEYLASECVTCHRVDGSETNIPDITGWDDASFIAVMTAYKDRERSNSVMQTIAGGLEPEDMAALAAYFRTIREAE